jgi:lysophospholipase L1-like esterase
MRICDAQARSTTRPHAKNATPPYSHGSPRMAFSATVQAMLESGQRIVFQGDSITDAGRMRAAAAPNSPELLGQGYAGLCAWRLLADYPGLGLEIHNRGVSGNRVPDLDARWQHDCLALKPHLLSVLIGVNDLWHRLEGRAGGSIREYEQQYRTLVERTREALPDVRLVLCEPFTLRCGVVNRRWFPEFDELRAAAERVAVACGAIWVPFQSVFDDAVNAGTDPSYWAGDGVHPTPWGHQLLADAWLDCIGARTRTVRRRSSVPHP